MEILLRAQDSNNELLELLKILMGEDGLAFLNLDNAIATVKLGQMVWQAPFAIGLHVLPFLYDWKTVKQDAAVPDLVLLTLGLASQTFSNREDMTISELSSLALEPLEARYASLITEVPGYGLSEEQAHTLFHIRFALGVILLIKGDKERATRILREMAATKTKQKGTTWSSEGLGQLDVAETKALTAIVLQDFYAMRQDYDMSLYLLTKAVASNSSESSQSLLVVIPGLLNAFVQKCEGADSFENWVDLFDRFATIIELCGEADTLGDLPKNCRFNSPQYLAWLFGQFVARYAVKSGLYNIDTEQIFPFGYLGEDWGNGTVVASLLCEYDERRNWQILRQQHVFMWESSSRYQWLSLCEAGTQTDLYWAMRIGFADTFLEPSLTKIENYPIKFEDTISPKALLDIQDAMDIAYSNIPEGLVHRLLEKLELLEERLPPSKEEIVRQLQQRLGSVWSRLPTKVVDTLVKAENFYKSGVDTDNAKVWFHKAVEASCNCCVLEPLGLREIYIGFPPKGQNRKAYSKKIDKFLSLSEWSDVFEMLSVPTDKDTRSSGVRDLKQFIKEHFGELPLPDLRELSRSLRDFCQRKDSAHSHPSRCEEEVQELEQMRELALGIKRPSVIAQIFQLFGTGK